MPSSSKEYVTATILHEVLHAYFGYNGTILDHDYMAEKYINWYVNSLRNIYPNLPEVDAKRLAWGGLQYTQYYELFLTPDEKTEIYKTNNDYKTLIKGSPCQ